MLSDQKVSNVSAIWDWLWAAIDSSHIAEIVRRLFSETTYIKFEIIFLGGVVNSTVVPQVQAVFPQGALTKKIKVGLQVNMFRPRKNVPNGLLKKITVNHLPKKKRFSLIW